MEKLVVTIRGTDENVEKMVNSLIDITAVLVSNIDVMVDITPIKEDRPVLIRQKDNKNSSTLSSDAKDTSSTIPMTSRDEYELIKGGV